MVLIAFVVLLLFLHFKNYKKLFILNTFQISSLGGSFLRITQTIFAPWTLPGLICSDDRECVTD